jgi:hypothetical protein
MSHTVLQPKLNAHRMCAQEQHTVLQPKLNAHRMCAQEQYFYTYGQYKCL